MLALEWSLPGLEAWRPRAAVLVVIDVLSFTTAVDIAVGRGATIHPFPFHDSSAAEAEAARLGALLARRRGAGGYSLSRSSLATLPHGARLLLPSPNGSRLSFAAAGATMFAGCLRNAAAVAHAARETAAGGQIALIPAGERWSDGSLRPAVEDLLGAGAIAHHLALPMTPEAAAACDAFRAAAPHLAGHIAQSVSGRELIGRGYPDDVAVAVALNASSHAPRLRDGAYSAA